jgi:hypothetical protein
MSPRRKLAKHWTATDVELSVGAGKQTVTGYTSPRVPGLAVTPSLGLMSLYGDWSVTHISSGYRMASPQATLVDACRLALRLAPLGDWTRSRTAIRRDKKLIARVQAFYKEAPFKGVSPRLGRKTP